MGSYFFELDWGRSIRKWNRVKNFQAKKISLKCILRTPPLTLRRVIHPIHPFWKMNHLSRRYNKSLKRRFNLFQFTLIEYSPFNRVIHPYRRVIHPQGWMGSPSLKDESSFERLIHTSKRVNPSTLECKSSFDKEFFNFLLNLTALK